MADPQSPDDLAALLPFYVNGTLAEEGRARIEAALTASPDLRAELAEQQAFEALIVREGERLTPQRAETDVRLAGVLAELPGAAPPPQPAARQPLAGLMGLLNPRRWHPAVSLALALAVLGQAVWITRNERRDDYQTASGGDETPDAAAARLVLRLKPDAAWSDVEALLGDADLTIVAGPSEGRLTVRLDSPGSDPEAVRRALAASPLVAFAGVLK